MSAGKRILIVDDSPVVLAAAAHALVAAGYEVDTRNSVEEVGARGVDGFDLVLMDVQMPELFGDDVAAVLRHERGVRARIFLFSTLAESELRTRAAEARIDGYIAKQDGLEHLVDEVNRLFAEPAP